MLKHIPILYLVAMATMFSMVVQGVEPDGVAAGQQVVANGRLAQKWIDFKPRLRKTICPFHGQEDYDPDIISCGDVLVPEDRTDPDSRLIKLAVMIVSASGEDPPGGAVVRLDGGPGGSSVTVSRASFYSGAQGRQFREIAEWVFFDQRGTGYSEPAFCRVVPWPYQFGEASLAANVAAREAAIKTCLSEAAARGVRLDAYDNWQNALDVRDLRRALGHAQWSIFGLSYGTQLGQGVLQVDGEHIRAAVLDSVLPTGPAEARSRADMARGLEQALSAAAAGCPEQAPCQAWIADLPQRVATIAATYDAEPLLLDQLPPTAAQHGRMVIDGYIVTGFLFQLMYFRDYYSQLPIVLDVLERRDVIAMRAYASAIGYPLDHVWGSGMGQLISCHGHQPTAAQNRQALQDAPTLGPYFLGFYAYSGCETIYPAAPDPTRKVTLSAVPSLVVAGATDPITPPWTALEILPGLSNAQYVEFAYTGHGALLTSGDCGLSILLDFIRNPEAQVDTSCAANMPPPKFLTRWRAAPQAFEYFNKVQEGARPILPAFALLVLLVAFVLYPATAVVRRVDDHRMHQQTSAALSGGHLTSWLACMTGLAAVAFAAWTVWSWAQSYPLAVPVGLPNKIAIAGWLSVLAALLAGIGAYYAVRGFAARTTSVGTLLASVFIALAAVVVGVFLHSLGAGPI